MWFFCNLSAYSLPESHQQPFPHRDYCAHRSICICLALRRVKLSPPRNQNANPNWYEAWLIGIPCIRLGKEGREAISELFLICNASTVHHGLTEKELQEWVLKPRSNFFRSMGFLIGSWLTQAQDIFTFYSAT